MAETILDQPLKAKPDGTEVIEVQEAAGGVGSSKRVTLSTIAGGSTATPKNVKDYGATGDGKIAFTAAITAGTNTLTLTNTAGTPQDLFSADDVGKRIVVAWAGTNNANHYTTIASYVSPTQVTLTDNAVFTPPSGSMAAWYPVGRNDTPGIQAAIDATGNGSTEVFLPAGVYVYKGATAGTGALNNTNAKFLTALRGAGSQRTWLVCDSVADQANAIRFIDPNIGLNIEGFSVFGPGVNAIAGGDVYLGILNQAVTQQIDISNVNVYHSCGYGFYISVPILVSFRNCLTCWTLDHGFYAHDGTSVHYDACVVLSSSKAGFCSFQQSYSAFTACAAEGAGIGYYMQGSNTVVFNGCGGEVLNDRSAAHGALYNGNMFVIDGGSGGVTLNSCFGRHLPVSASRYVKTVNNASLVTVTGFRVNNVDFTPAFDFEIGTGSVNCTFNNCTPAITRLSDSGTNTAYNLGRVLSGDNDLVDITTNTTLAITNNYKFHKVNLGSIVTVTVPPEASVAWPADSQMEFMQMGAGAVSIAAGAGVTLRKRAATQNSAGQYAVCGIRKVGTNEWVLYGDFA